MFCPQCGNDCGDSRFCGRCGTQVQAVAVQEPQQSAWSVGMACPHCGGTKLNGNNCAFCGAQLIVDVSKGNEDEKDSYEIPYGRYGDSLVNVTLFEKHLKANFRNLFAKLSLDVPYCRIKKLEYVHPIDQAGQLTIYWEKAEDVSYSKQGADNGTLYISKNDYDEFYHLCYVLKFLNPSIQVETNTPPDTAEMQFNVAESAKVIDLDSYFHEFNPYRKRAIKEIWKRAAIPRSIGERLIYKAFDQRQRELYEHDPSLAIRDMNRIRQETFRLIDERVQEIEEHAALLKRHR